MLLKFRVDDAKSLFFDRRQTISALDQTAYRGLSKWGAYSRRKVRRTLRKARQKTLAEMTSQERQRYRIRQEYAKRQGLPKPKRPLAPSKPGEPPRMRVGLIKKLMFFAYDPGNRSVVVGPAIIDNPTGAPETLEYGGFVETPNGRFRIEARPYMNPVFDEMVPQLPRFLAGEA